MSGVPHRHRTRWTTGARDDAIALRQLGLSYGSIAIALQHFHGIQHITGERVRKTLRAGGIDAEPRNARAYRAKGTT